MNSRRTKAVLSITFIAVMLGIAGWEEFSLRVTATAVRTESAKRTSLQETVARARQQLVALEKNHSELPSSLAAQKMTVRKVGTAKPTVEIYDSAAAAALYAFAAVPWDDVVLDKDAQLQARYLNSMRQRLDSKFAPLWRALDLSAGEIQKFKEMMMENAERVLDIKAVGRDQGLTQTDPAIKTLLQQADEQLRMGETAVLGNAGNLQLKNYERQTPAREMVDGLAGVLAFTDVPLEGKQADQLAQILVDANSRYAAGGSAERWPQLGRDHWGEIIAEGKGVVDPTDWDQVFNQARRVLSDSQFIIFKQKAEREKTTVQLYNVMQQGTNDPVVGFIFGRRK